jgi:hypothetical protein
MSGRDASLKQCLLDVEARVLSAYGAMKRAVEEQGLAPPDLNPDGGIAMIPYVYLWRVKKLGPDPDYRKVPRFYPEGSALPEPFRSLSPLGPALAGDAMAALLDRTLGPSPASVPSLFFGFTALHLVADSDRADAVSVLVTRRGIDPWAQNVLGDTPLHTACTVGSWSAARALVAHDREGRAIRTRNHAGRTPLGTCALMNRPAGIDLLYKAGGRMSEPELDEIAIAARWGCRAAFERLRERSNTPAARLRELERVLDTTERRQG